MSKLILASFFTRYESSLAEALVNDSASIYSGLHLPDKSKYLMYPTMVVVFPVPAPAITR